MSIKFLGKRITIRANYLSPCAQMVNVPELQRNQRCLFCHYYANGRTATDVQDCIEAHSCGVESLLYVPLVNSAAQAPIPDADHFSPSPILRTTEIDNEKRYLQLWSCDIDGYQCCKLCYFYPARVEASQTIEACSNSHDCGRNASWLDLLEVEFTQLYSLPAYNNFTPAQNRFITIDGTHINSAIEDISFGSDGLAYATFHDNRTAYILNFVDWCQGCGSLLASPWANALTWNFSRSYEPTRTYSRPIVLMLATNDPIGSLLQTKGITEKGLFGSLGYMFRHTFNTNDVAYFAERDYSAMQRAVSSKLVVVIFDLTRENGFHFRFGTTNYYLTTPYNDAPPSKWQRTTIDPTAMQNYPVITMSNADSYAAQFLQAIGVRASLFDIIR